MHSAAVNDRVALHNTSTPQAQYKLEPCAPLCWALPALLATPAVSVGRGLGRSGRCLCAARRGTAPAMRTKPLVASLGLALLALLAGAACTSAAGFCGSDVGTCTQEDINKIQDTFKRAIEGRQAQNAPLGLQCSGRCASA